MKERNETSSTGDEPRRTAADAGADALAWAVSSGAASNVVRGLRVREQRRRRRRLTIALGGAAVLALAGTWLSRTPARSVSPAAGESRSAVVSLPSRQVLPDGTIVDLKDGAQISLGFTPEVRLVRLLSSEAHFQVAKNPARPFVVVANGIQVRAVGTAFDVQVGARAVDVLVTEGRVAVDKPAVEDGVTASAAPMGIAPSPASVAMVDAGYRVAVDVAPTAAKPPVVAASAAEQGSRLAWRVPRLEFSSTPLSEVIPLFNKYGQSRFVLDPALSRLELSGALRADDIDSLLLLLQNEFAIHAERRDGGEVFLARR